MMTEPTSCAVCMCGCAFAYAPGRCRTPRKDEPKEREIVDVTCAIVHRTSHSEGGGFAADNEAG